MREKDISRNIVPQHYSLREVMGEMDKGIYGAVIIVDDEGVMRGMLTDGDIRRAILKGADLDDLASTFMNMNYTCGQSESSHEENIKLLSGKIRHLPILDSQRRPVDMISWAEMWRIPVTEPYLGGNELKYVSDCVTSNWISSQGHYVKQFEKMFSEYFSADYAISTSSGTTALHLALLALGVGPGDEVILPSLTFAACANVVIHCGARPVFVDVSEKTWTLDPVKLEESITEKTKVIMPVHLYGHPCDMEQIVDVAQKNQLYVVEDCAEALGARYKSKLVGTFGDVACFSFFANKVITTGEGGMVVTADEKLYEKMLVLRDHGMSRDKKYWHEVVGFNFRMTNIQAAIGVAQMERIDKFLENREVIAGRYKSNLSGIDGITLPPEEDWGKNIFWLYSILVDEDKLHISADGLMEKLRREGVESRPLFAPLHEQQPYPKPSHALPVTEKLSRCGVSLPTSNDTTIEEVDRVCRSIKTILKNAKVLSQA